MIAAERTVSFAEYRGAVDMKIKLVKYLCAVLTVVILVSCADSSGKKQNSSVNSGSTAENASNEVESSQNTSGENFESYTITSGDSEFNSAMNNNSIDKSYSTDVNAATTTKEFADTENKYIEIWNDEMNYSAEILKSYLSETDKAKFTELQDEWYKSAEDDLKFSNSIISNGDYGIRLGSSSQYMLLSKKRKLLRNRTVSIKYLTYLIETQTDNPDETKNQKWSEFKFNP